MLWLVITLLIVFLPVTILFINWKRKDSYFSKYAHAPCMPIVGTTFYLDMDPSGLFKQFREFSKENGYLYVLWLFYEPLIFVGRVDLAEFVLKSQEIITKSFVYSFLHPWLGTGLLTSTHEKWKSRRRAITPTFHFTILNDFQSIFIKQAQVLVEKLKSKANSGDRFDLQVPVSLATLDIICESAMGVPVNAQSQSESEYVNAIFDMSSEAQMRQRYPFYWPDFLYWSCAAGRRFSKALKIVHGFTTKVINDKIEGRSKAVDVPTQKKTKAFMDMLLDLYEKGEIDVEGIREEVDTFMFEGHDTTAAGLSWTLFLLGHHPDIQRKLQMEVDAIAEQEGDLVDNIKGCKYLECVIKEGLRLHPPVAVFARELEKDTDFQGSVFPKGTTIVLDVLSLHTNPEYWDNPTEFNPDRFTEEKFLTRNPYCYVPFSAGARNCIGKKFAMLEEKILMYHFLLNYNVVSEQKEENVSECMELIHRSNNGLFVTISPRKN